MSVTVKLVETRKELKQYIHLPAKIHKDHPNWVPPFYGDEWAYYNPKKNVLLSHCDTVLYLAYRDGKVVGRIMGIIAHKYNEIKNENSARFNYLEAWDDREVIESLISAVESWARERGKDRLVGPFAFTDKDPQGYLIEGYNEVNVIASHCNFKYLIDHLEALGFVKDIDLVTYKIIIPDTNPDLFQRVEERIMRNNEGLKVLHFTSRRKIKPYIRPVFSLINDTFVEIYGFMPFTLKEMDEFANRYLMVIDPRFVKVILNAKDEPVAHIITMPDISKGIQKSRGYLFPFGFIPVLTAGRKTKQLNGLLVAIRHDYQGKGLDTMLATAVLNSARKAGLTHVDGHLMMETNKKVRAEMEILGGKVYKRFRVFQKAI